MPGVMWLLNHGTLRRFEVAQLRLAGVTRIYTPKRFPYDEGNLSASVDASLDATLELPEDDLSRLNAQDWYDAPDDEAWRIANRSFGIAFVGFFPRQIEAVLRHFAGVVVIRVFGLARGVTYSALIREHLPLSTRIAMRDHARRLWFATAYDHLAGIEEPFFADRACFLPVGLSGEDRSAEWQGDDARVFFVCPRIGSSPYFRDVYDRFRRTFGKLPHVIGGAQPVAVDDPAVIGYVPRETHERNMRSLRVMYYHSREPFHVHYHPFEAIQAGMPLVYLAGGILDRFGGTAQPGRCTGETEARRKLERILAGDRALIARIREAQPALLAPMLADNCADAWQAGFARIARSAEAAARAGAPGRARAWRIALIVPVGYRGGSLRGAKLLAEAIAAGSRAAGEPAEVVFGHLDDASVYDEREFRDLPAGVSRRPFRWKTLQRDEARRSVAYAGIDANVEAPQYAVPDDGATQFGDCDLWVLVSDRITLPLLPLRPYVMVVYDYLQRYLGFLDPATNHAFLAAQHAAERVIVTTQFTFRDARDYAGLPLARLRRLPMLVPAFDAAAGPQGASEEGGPGYFVWTTNLALHKNHANAAQALAIYYDELDGELECRVTGVDTERLLTADLPHLATLKALRTRSRGFRRRVKILGELPDRAYRRVLAGGRFLWHAGRIDNGTFSVVEAAWLGVPSLSSDYPAMREIAATNELAIEWMASDDPEAMAAALKRMETQAAALAARVPSAERLARNGVSHHAGAYWREVRACL